MDELSIKIALKALKQGKREGSKEPDREVEILYWYCHQDALNDDDIAKKLRNGRSGNWVWQKRQIIDGKLEVLGITQITAEVCAVLQEMVGEPPVFEPWPPDISEPIPIIEPPEQDREPTNRLRTVGLVILSLVLDIISIK